MSSNPSVSQGTLNQVCGSLSLLSIIKFLNGSVYGASLTVSWELVPYLNIPLGQNRSTYSQKTLSTLFLPLYFIKKYISLQCAFVWGCLCATECVGRSENNFHHVTTRDRIQVITLSSKHLYLLRHVVTPSFYCCFLYTGLVIKPKAPYTVGKHSTSVLYPQPHF